MAIEVGELFIRLGLQGQDKTIQGLQQTEKEMSGLASTSLEAKAAILGALYGLEQLFSKSGQTGTDLTNFNALLGEGTQTLQQYQYALRQAGVSNEETTSTFKTLQTQMANTFLGHGAPAGLARVAKFTGGNITRQDVEKYMKNPELLLNRLQDYVSKARAQGEDLGVVNQTLGSFGLGEGARAALIRGAITPTALKQAPTYSEKEVGSLNKANIAWSNLNNSIQMAVGHFNALNGQGLVNDFTKLIIPTEHFVGSLVKVADKLHIFQALGDAFTVLGNSFDRIATGIDRLSKFTGSNILNLHKIFMSIEKTVNNIIDSLDKLGLLRLSENIFGQAVSVGGGKETKETPQQKIVREKEQVKTSILFSDIGKGLLSAITGGLINIPPGEPGLAGKPGLPGISPLLSNASDVASTPKLANSSITTHNTINNSNNINVTSNKVDDKDLARQIAHHASKVMSHEVNKAAKQLSSIRTGS